MTAGTLELGTKPIRRRGALEPYAIKVQEALSRQPLDGTRPPKVSIDGIALRVEPWVAARVDPRSAEPEAGSEETELLRQALALWLKCASDVTGLRQCVQSGSGNLYALQAELMLDSSFGSALLREFQDSIDGLVKRGDLEEARRFSKFQHQLRFVVRDLTQAIEASNGARSAERAQHRPDPTRLPERTVEDVLREVDAERAEPRRRQRPPAAKPVSAAEAVPRPWRATKLLIGLDTIALMVWLVMSAQHRILQPPPRTLTRADFPDAAPLTDVTARPPAVYASVDQETWSGFDDDRKRLFMNGMGSVLLTNGYGGLLLKSSDGQIVGQWLQTGGTRLLATDRTAVAVATTTEASGAPQYSRFVP